MEIDLDDIGDTREFYGDSQLTYMGTYNGLPIVWKPSEQTDEDNLVSELFFKASTKQDDLNSTLGKQGFQLASANPQDFHSYVMLTGNNPYGENGPHKEGEGGYASTETTMGCLTIVGGFFVSFVNPALGTSMMGAGVTMIVGKETANIIDRYGKDNGKS